MRFTTLEQVIARWAERYTESGDRDDNLPTPGYSEEAIQAHEQRLIIRFHPSFRQVLLRAKLDTVGFHRLYFAGSSEMDYLSILRDISIDDFFGTPPDEQTILIAGGDGDEVILNNQDGTIAAGDHELRFAGFSRAADDMEQFICLLATIVDETENIWRNFDTRQQAVEAGNQYLDKLGITQNRAFWLDVFRGTV